jgi:hypothetical protein
VILTRAHVRAITQRILRKELRRVARELRRALRERDDVETALLDLALVLERGPKMEDSE